MERCEKRGSAGVHVEGWVTDGATTAAVDTPLLQPDRACRQAGCLHVVRVMMMLSVMLHTERCAEHTQNAAARMWTKARTHTCRAR